MDDDSINAAQEAVDLLGDIADLSNTVHVEVAIDTVASALQKKPKVTRRQGRIGTKLELADILAEYVEDGLVDPIAVTLAEEIKTLIEFKSYEGYSDEYVADRLDSLLSDLQDELRTTISKLRSEISA